jgi:tRNA dimethylallyltransferase
MIIDMKHKIKDIKQLAIIGATASGKSALAIEIAQKQNGIILSLDSLSIYKHIDIASAKPTIEERGEIPHYGIDILYPNEPFDVTIYMRLYKEVYSRAVKEGKNLIIVGGSSFYLKSMIDGISPLPYPTSTQKEEIVDRLKNPQKLYSILYDLDPKYMQNIKPNDIYRIEKAFSIYLVSSLIPSIYFRDNPPIPTIKGDIPIYAIDTPKEMLRERITKRTYSMLESGLIDEVAELEYRYTRRPNAMKSIGIKETLEYLDGRVDKNRLIEKIITNTARLAKRQGTFNRSQFERVNWGRVEELRVVDNSFLI